METIAANHLVVADSSGLVSLLSASDANHQAARRSLAHLTKTPCSILVPTDVFTETINTLNKIASHSLAVDACAYLAQTPPFLVTESPSEIHRDAVARFQKHGVGTLSLTDWIVLAVADAFATKELFAFDEGMARQGYLILPFEEVREAA